MASVVYVHVKKVDGKLSVAGVRKCIQDDHLWLFDEEDRNVDKHPIISAELKKQSVTNYQNIKIAGTHLPLYYDSKTDTFTFNGKTLMEDKEKSFTIGDDGKLLNLGFKILNN